MKLGDTERSSPSGRPLHISPGPLFHGRRDFLIPVVALALLVTAGAWVRTEEQLRSPSPELQPTFEKLTASIPELIAGTSTAVVFRIAIDAPTLNPTTVELQRVDAQGNVLGTLGRMDETITDSGPPQTSETVGGSGREASERIAQNDAPRTLRQRFFSHQVTLNEPASVKLHFRVAAAFRGNERNAFSETLLIQVWQRIETPSLGMTVFSPPGWTIAEGGNTIQLVSPELQNLLARATSEVPSAEIVVRPFSNPHGLSLDEFASSFSDGWFETYKTKTFESINGHSAIRYSDVGDDVPHKTLLGLFIEKGSRVVLVTLLPVGNAEESVTAFNEVVRKLLID